MLLVLGWVLRIVLVLLVLRLVGRFLLGLVQGLRGVEVGPGGSARVREARGARAVALVRDPVCGTYVVPERALMSRAGGATYHFCSEACRNTFERTRGTSQTA